MKFRSTRANRLAPASAKRQFDVTRLAMTLLGREGALQFMNDHNALLGGRPIDLAIASNDGRMRIEAELVRMRDAGPAGPPNL